ncbi:MAG TPA: response regulator [Thermoanaerobaculia bacterium]|nr:response regulator [Thermoanaerobaculia bacterium]
MKQRALIVDDDYDIRELLRVLLEAIDLDVSTCGDGMDAMQLDTSQYDVILLDLNMPVFDGERLVDYWTMTDPLVLQRVIVLSAYWRHTKGKKLPTFATLAKPFDHEELLRVVAECIAEPEEEKCACQSDE